MSNIQSLEVVDHGSEKQLQVGENLSFYIFFFGGGVKYIKYHCNSHNSLWSMLNESSTMYL